MKVSLIAAMTENRVIGIDNKLPWKLPADLAWFKKHTLNKPVVMGRRTWESLPFRPLPGRLNIVITGDKNYRLRNTRGEEVKDNVSLTDSPEQAIALAESRHYEELMFIGGASLYAQVLDKVDCIYLTLVHEQIQGDAWFPELDLQSWQEIFCELHGADKNNPHQFSFHIYCRSSG